MKAMVRTSTKKRITATWFGHSAFKFESPTGKIVLIDPWLENPNVPSGAKDLPRVDLILITHGHSDHIGNTVEIAIRTGAKVVCIYEIAVHLKNMGVKNVQSMNKGGTFDADGIKVTMTDAKHSSDIDLGDKVIPGGEAAGFVVRFENGFTIYHAGDTALFGDMKYIGTLYKPDAAFIPIGDHYTMGPREAALACALLNPKQIIGMHYGTFPLLTGTPAALKKFLPAKLKKRVKVLEPGIPMKL